ncbi:MULTISPECIES: hypothetical protein [Butyricimonas]|jgi:hypothetical protein|uniref:hypothetical protein n=1 Tax=Butyricimonas TaxID=574697 RepID=UPI000B37D0B3|nr:MULTISPECIES: hypothetical protein [Butyricimonas]OUN64936.1 hypothetical protein B5G13_09930 [Butyricimonas sp. An62]
MKMYYKVITILLFCVMTFQVGAQKYKTVLPYRMVGGKMIVDLVMNGTSRSFIFDTGGRTALTGEICEELGLTVVDSLVVTDVNSKKAAYPLVSIESLMTPDQKINFKHVSAMKLAKPSPFECFHTDGLIGSDLLVRTIVEIDGKNKTITITSAENPSTVSLRKMLPFTKSGMPIILLQAGAGNNITALFDTGCPSFFSLKVSDYETLKTTGAFQVLSEGYGEGSIGVAGMAEADISHRVCLPVLSVGGTKFQNVTSETSTPPFTLLGVKLLDYGKVTLDYPRARFYFEANEAVNDLSSKHYNVALRVKDGELIISTVWSAMKGVVEVGDKVTRINGKPVRMYDFCESIVNGIPELKGKKKTRLTVQTKQGEKVIVYQKE